MVSIKNRIKLVWHVLFAKKYNMNIDKIIEGYIVCDTIREGTQCDNFLSHRTGCKNDAKVCLSRGHLKIEIAHDDHVHLCDSCAKKLLGETHEFR